MGMVHRRSVSGLRRVVLAAALATFVLTACGDAPLQSVGQRTGEWIGPLAEELVFLPSE